VHLIAYEGIHYTCNSNSITILMCCKFISGLAMVVAMDPTEATPAMVDTTAGAAKILQPHFITT